MAAFCRIAAGGCSLRNIYGCHFYRCTVAMERVMNAIVWIAQEEDQ
jgi:hypothetical protein